MTAIEIVKEQQLCLATQSTRNTQQSVGLEPEIIRLKIVDRGIDEQDFGLHDETPLTADGSRLELRAAHNVPLLTLIA